MKSYTVLSLLRWGLCLLHTLEELQPQFSDIRTPMLIIQGEDDKICHVSGAEMLCSMAACQDKILSVSTHILAYTTYVDV